ncbi:MAG: hypothetical protein QXM96_00345 [Candidatus Woesearchaeota archaeon]
MLYNRTHIEKRTIHLLSWILFILIIILVSLNTKYFVNVKAEINETINSTINQTLNQTQDQTENQISLNSTLIVLHSNNSYVNESVKFYAYYKNQSGNIIFGNCTIKIENQTNLMIYNQTSYFFEKIFNSNKTYNYFVNCSSSNYLSINITGLINISLNFNQTNLINQNNTNNQNINNNSNITNIFDKDNDGFTNETDCNDENQNINPGKKEILYNNFDDDCNALTTDYIILNINTDKSNYNANEVVKINFYALNYSDTYLTINTPTNVSYVYIFSNKSYPLEQNFSLTTINGKYTIEAINYYENYSIQKIIDFNVSSDFNVDIEANQTEAYEYERIHFKAIITGNSGNVNMIWKMDDNNEVYQNEFDYNYSNARTYNIVLIATDQAGNQAIKTKQVKINKRYFLKLKVIDNSTNEAILNSTIKLDNINQQVNSTGEYEFFITNKTYNIKVSSEGYYSYESDLKINNSLLFTVKLVKNLENIIPEISLIEPSNNSNFDITINKPIFKFKFLDNSNADCSLLISNNEWFEDYQTLFNLSSNLDYIFNSSIINFNDFFENGYNQKNDNQQNNNQQKNQKIFWKIKCVDEDGNIGYSQTYQFNLNYQNENSETEALEYNQNENETTYQVIENIYSIIPDFEKLTPDEKIIAQYLDMETMLKDAKRKLEMANRDLFNLRYEQNTESIIQKREEIYTRIEKIKDETPLSLNAKNKVSFVKYIEDEEIEKYLEDYLKLKNINIDKKIKRKIIEQNKILQKKATIETNAYNVELKYISGRVDEITLIVRKIDSEELSNINYVEFIPKEIIESTEDIIFINKDNNVLEKDPVFEYDLSKAKDIIYYTKENIDLSLLPKIKTALFKTEVDESLNKITGFAIFNNLGISDTNKKILIVELFVIFILLGIYLYYYFTNNQTIIIKQNKEANDFEAYEKDMSNYSSNFIANEINANKVSINKKDYNDSKIYNYNSSNTNVNSKISLTSIDLDLLEKYIIELSNIIKQKNVFDFDKANYLLSLIIKSSNDLKNKNLRESAIKYHEAKFLYDLLNKEDKKIFNKALKLLHDKITLFNIENIYNKSLYELSLNNIEKSIMYYKQLSSDYEKLNNETKKEIFGKYCELALLIKNFKTIKNEK